MPVGSFFLHSLRTCHILTIEPFSSGEGRPILSFSALHNRGERSPEPSPCAWRCPVRGGARRRRESPGKERGRLLSSRYVPASGARQSPSLRGPAEAPPSRPSSEVVWCGRLLESKGKRGDALLSLPLFFVGGCCSAAASRAFVRASDLRPWLAAAAAASDRSRHPPDGATPMEFLEERGLVSTVNTLSVRVIFASGLRL